MVLACLCADRPAAVELTGGPHYSGGASPCLRCEIAAKDIPNLRTARHRDSHAHNVATIEQVYSVPRAMLEDRERWDEEQAMRCVTVRERQNDTPMPAETMSPKQQRSSRAICRHSPFYRVLTSFLAPFSILCTHSWKALVRHTSTAFSL